MAMERTRIAKAEDVTLARRGEQINGALHLTPHHIIFVHTPTTKPITEPQSQPSARPRELWITYPIIAFCTLRTAPSASRQPSSIRLRCRDFTYICLYLKDEAKAKDVYDSIKAWTCKLGRIEKLYAFSYQPPAPEKNASHWNIYDPTKELRRMGVLSEQPGSKWRISKINVDYKFSPTYPALLAVPTSISDNTLNYASRYRSRARIPALTYLHPVNNCSITRCSQPLVGVRQNRSIQDEKLLAAIFATTRNERPLSQVVSPPPEREDSSLSKESYTPSLDGDLQQTSTEELEDAVISKLRGDEEEDAEDEEKKPLVYGAQQRNMIIDARPTVNAYAMQVAGMGSENMDHYKFATKAYLGIDNIHVMRDSLSKVVEALKDSDLTPLPPNREILQKSHWLKHIANMLDGVGLIARQVGLQHSHVLIHCSDGWDRTSQLSSLSQICLDPYYRTIEGFMVLIEKDWLSFGHMFRHRTGFLSSEKWFQIENERISGGNEDPDKPASKSSEAMAGAQKTIENALLSAKGFFSNKQHNDSRESLAIDSDAEAPQAHDSDSPLSSKRGGAAASPTPKDKSKSATTETKVKETAPIFHQFLDATYQLMYQHPTRFEFNPRFLRRLLYHLYSCQYGTFLFDNERSRVEAKLSERTRSVWDYFLSRREMWLNPEWDGGVVDDNVRDKERLIFPRPEEVRWWADVFGRTDEEMNSALLPPVHAVPSTGTPQSTSDGETNEAVVTSQVPSGTRTPVLIGVETSEEKVGVATTSDETLKKIQSDSALGTKFQEANGTAKVMHKTDPHISSSKTSTSNLRQVITLAMSESTPNLGQKAQDDTMAPKIGTVPNSSHDGEDGPNVAEDPLATLSDDLDPLGIGEATDRAPRVVSRTTKMKEQMEMLMQ